MTELVESLGLEVNGPVFEPAPGVSALRENLLPSGGGA